MSKVTPGGKVTPITEIGADRYYISCFSALDNNTTFTFQNVDKGWRGQVKGVTDVATLRFEGNILVEAK